MSESKSQGNCMEMFFECHGLPDDNALSKCDPYLKLFSRKPAEEPDWSLTDTSEVHSNNNNPTFAKRFEMLYKFAENRECRVEIWSKNLVEGDSLTGVWEFSISGLLTANNYMMDGNLVQSKTHPHYDKNAVVGQITCRGQLIDESDDTLVIEVRGEDLCKHDFMGKSDPFLTFSRQRDDGTTLQVYETAIMPRTLNPKWEKFEIKARHLCCNNYDLPITVKCWDWDEGSEPDAMGEIIFTVNEILKDPKNFPLYKYKKAKKTKKKGAQASEKDTSKNRGFLGFQRCQVASNYSFEDFVKAGMDLQLVVGVDYTSGKQLMDMNGKEHKMRDAEEYGNVMRSIGKVLTDYDSDGQVPVFGFGAIPEGEEKTSMCFNVNGKEDPNCQLVEGAVSAFMDSLDRVKCSGPTLFVPCIRKAMEIAAKEWTAKSQHYTILLMLTSGAINDMQHSINALVEASKLPLSVIIAGVGNNDYESMCLLDGDETKGNRLQNSQGVYGERDLVQFVKVDDYKGKHESEFAEAVLKEIPQQCRDFIKVAKALPMTHKAAAFQQMTVNRKDEAKRLADLKANDKNDKAYVESIDLLKNVDFIHERYAKADKALTCDDDIYHNEL